MSLCPLYVIFYHIVFICMCVFLLRQNIFNNKWPQVNKFYKLAFTSLLLSCQKYAANFIDKAWEIWKTSLYVNST